MMKTAWRKPHLHAALYSLFKPVRVALAVFLLSAAPAAGEESVLFREDFTSLDHWTPLFFPKIEKHSVYEIVKDGNRHVLRAESRASASALVHKYSFSVYDYPRMKWRWKVRNVYEKGDPRTRGGDDYPLRVYVMFEYDPQRASAFQRMKYGMARKIYGSYPPDSSLNYVWASRAASDAVMTSPYTDRAKMIFLQQGGGKAGTWQDEDVDILSDYRKAFGTDPPARARIAIMNDSDNTGESSVSYLEYLEVYR